MSINSPSYKRAPSTISVHSYHIVKAVDVDHSLNTAWVSRIILGAVQDDSASNLEGSWADRGYVNAPPPAAANRHPGP
jgi:hypothetical protein